MTFKWLSSSAVTICSVMFLTACGLQSGAGKTAETVSLPVSSISSEPSGPTPLAISQTLTSTPVAFGCEQLISLQTLYEFNPNYALDASKSPVDGSPAKQIQDLRGLVCTYVNLSSGDEVQLAISQLDAAGIQEITRKLENNDSPSNAFSQIVKNKAYFSVNNGVGVAQIVTSKYWIVFSSTSLLMTEDIAPLVDSAIENSALF